MLGDSICFTKEGLDPSVVNHFSSQCPNGGGETTVFKFHFEFGFPCLELESVIGRSWISHPQDFGSALESCSERSLCEQ